MSVKIFFGQVLLYFISYEIHFEYISYVIFKIFNWTPKRNPKTGRHEDSFLSSNTQGGLLLCLPICSCGRPYLTYYGIGGRAGVVSQIITIHYNSTWGGVSLETPRSWYLIYGQHRTKKKKGLQPTRTTASYNSSLAEKFLFLTENWQEHLKSHPEGMDYEIVDCKSGSARAGLVVVVDFNSWVLTFYPYLWIVYPIFPPCQEINNWHSGCAKAELASSFNLLQPLQGDSPIILNLSDFYLFNNWWILHFSCGVFIFDLNKFSFFLFVSTRYRRFLWMQINLIFLITAGISLN